MRIADRRRHAVGSTQRSNSSGVSSERFDVAMGVDESRDDDFAADVDLARAAVFAHRADDAVAADRDVALDEFAADEIEDPAALQHQSASASPAPARWRGEERRGVAHGRASGSSWRFGHCFRLVLEAQAAGLPARSNSRPSPPGRWLTSDHAAFSPGLLCTGPRAQCFRN